ncbi:MAG: multidrug efflux SMR transporter [Cucumibacter sp.]
MAYVWLFASIVTEVIATTALKSVNNFTAPIPTAIVVFGYAATFYLFYRAIETIQVGVAYAIWSGLGMVLIALLAWMIHRQALDTPAFIGIGLILSGVVVLQIFSKTAGH